MHMSNCYWLQRDPGGVSEVPYGRKCPEAQPSSLFKGNIFLRLGTSPMQRAYFLIYNFL